MAGKKKSTPIPLQSLDTLFGTTCEDQAGIQQIALDNLHSFFNHPFKVLDDDKMIELSESVRTHGVLVPGIVRIKDTGGYEIIAGQRAGSRQNLHNDRNQTCRWICNRRKHRIYHREYCGNPEA